MILPNSLLQSTSCGKIKTGQCQRYHAYDSSPIRFMRGVLKKHLILLVRGPAPESRRHAAPKVGIRLIDPGRSISGVNMTPAETTRTKPIHPSQECRRTSTGLTLGIRLVTPPSANSHARVCVPKNAQGWFVEVTHTQQMKDIKKTVPMTMGSVFLLGPKRKANRITTGQTT